jgi:hypothetical protein
MKLSFLVSLSMALWAHPVFTSHANERWEKQIRADWIAQEHSQSQTNIVNSPERDDASGGCDGIKNGEAGFHTGKAREPWWEVQLGSREIISRIVIWNREDLPERASRLIVKLSEDGRTWKRVYQHDGTPFRGFSDNKPLVVAVSNEVARIVRIQLPGEDYFHLDEVEVFGPAEPARNLALHKPANQVSASQWSVRHSKPTPINWQARTRETLEYCRRLIIELQKAGIDVSEESGSLSRLNKLQTGKLDDSAPPPLYYEARRLQRTLALANPLLKFDALLFTKRVPASYNHMSDQYYGWWSKPGGGIYILRNFRGDAPTEECLTDSFKEPGSFLRPTLSYDGKRILFAWARFYPDLSRESNKLDKANVPEPAFYHLFEMDVDGTNVRQLTRGKYDDFDARYLPDGRIVFLSTRRGQAVQAGCESATRTLLDPALPDSYVRCGGGPSRPVAVYTLHVADPDGTRLKAISPFEMFEWTPEVGHDGSLLFSRWDYIDRDNMPYMGLWAMSPDGANPRVIYGNYTKAPHCTFEPKPIPGSHKIIFTASGHHSQTMGSLVLLDPGIGTEGAEPLTRLTPEVPFPEIEAWPQTYYASPWPLSERFHLVAWGHEGETVPGPSGWNRWHSVQRPANGMSLYLFDAAGTKELLFHDPKFACGDPIPLRARPTPPTVATPLNSLPKNEGRFLLTDVYRGLNSAKAGEITSLRIIAVPPKTHPTMNFPVMGLTRDDPGKCVLGTVPVESDGSAYFRAPAGVIVFFQALDKRGVAVQTMKSVTHLQPGQTLSCAGCHEDRNSAPVNRPSLASMREPSRITVGPSGSWPLRFDELIQPVLDRNCTSCHRSDAQDKLAAKFDLTPAKSYEALTTYGKPSLTEQVQEGYVRGYSIESDGLAAKSALFSLLTKPGDHPKIDLAPDDLERFIVWMDSYAQRIGSFSKEQEEELKQLRSAHSDLLNEQKAPVVAVPSSIQQTAKSR